MSKGHLPALYVIIKVSPHPPWTCPLHPIPPNFQPLPHILTPPSLVGIGPKHSKRQKTVSEELSAGLVVVAVALCSGNQKGQSI